MTKSEKRKDRIPTIGVVAIKDGQVLLVREERESLHLTGMYGLPSGRVEEGETELDAAVREFSEETGLVADKKDFSQFPKNYFEASIPRKDGTIADFAWRVFKVTNFQGELKGNKETTPGWHSFEDLEKLERAGKLLPNAIAAVKAATTS